MPLMRCVSNTAKTSLSWGMNWNSQSWALGPGGDQAVSSRPSDQQQRTPDGRTWVEHDASLVCIRWIVVHTSGIIWMYICLL